MFTGDYMTKWETSLKDELLSVHPRAEIGSVSFSSPYDYMEGPIEIRFKYSIPDYALVTEEEIIFTPVVVSNIFKRAMSHLYTNTTPEKRQYQFRDRCSRTVYLDETVELPGRAAVAYMPSTNMSSGSGASFKGGYELQGKQLTVTEVLEFKKRIYDPEDWGSFREAVMSQNKIANEPVILKFEE